MLAASVSHAAQLALSWLTEATLTLLGWDGAAFMNWALAEELVAELGADDDMELVMELVVETSGYVANVVGKDGAVAADGIADEGALDGEAGLGAPLS